MKTIKSIKAAIWMNTLVRVREQTYKYSPSDPVTEKMLNKFYEATDYEMECHKITGKRFNITGEHTEFIKTGGCDKLINILADILFEEMYDLKADPNELNNLCINDTNNELRQQLRRRLELLKKEAK